MCVSQLIEQQRAAVWADFAPVKAFVECNNAYVWKPNNSSSGRFFFFFGNNKLAFWNPFRPLMNTFLIKIEQSFTYSWTADILEMHMMISLDGDYEIIISHRHRLPAVVKRSYVWITYMKILYFLLYVNILKLHLLILTSVRAASTKRVSTPKSVRLFL